MKVVEFPAENVQDIPRALRSLAETIETGLEGDAAVPGLTDATVFAWVSASDARQVQAGMIGGASNRFTLAGLLQAGAVKVLAQPEDA